MHKVKLEQFEGPLDLLLQLIEKEELDITQVSLAKIADEYLSYIDQLEQVVPEEVADFLVIAAKLIYIKSKSLIPSLDVDEEEDGDLEKQLKIYKQYYEASKEIEKLIGKKKWSYVREMPMKVKIMQEFTPPPSLTPSKMQEAYSDIISRLEVVRKLPKIMIAKAVSIKERIGNIREELMSSMKSNFSKFMNKGDKVDTIVSFLALLELVKQRAVTVSQTKLFEDIDIELKKQDD